MVDSLGPVSAAPPSAVPPDTTIFFVDREIRHVRELYDMRLSLMEDRRIESKVDAAVTLAAALAAQEDKAATESIGQTAAISVLTSALSILEKQVIATQSSRLGSQDAIRWIFAAIAAGGVIFGITR